MCLRVNHKFTNQHSKLTENLKFTFYKKFIYAHNSKDIVLTPHQMWPVPLTTNFIRASGALEIQTKHCCNNISHDIYEGAIHAYQEILLRCKCSSCFSMTSFFVPITVYADDIIAFGDEDVCFFKFKFELETIEYIKEMRNKHEILKIYPNRTERYL